MTTTNSRSCGQICGRSTTASGPLHAEIQSGNYIIGRDEDLPCMPALQKVRKRLPIVSLIDAVNNAHQKGFARD